jgi:hypothetical protein
VWDDCDRQRDGNIEGLLRCYIALREVYLGLIPEVFDRVTPFGKRNEREGASCRRARTTMWHVPHITGILPSAFVYFFETSNITKIWLCVI